MLSINTILKQFGKCLNMHGKILKWVIGEMTIVKYHNGKMTRGYSKHNKVNLLTIPY